jgi:hypothetical protein
MHGDIVSDGRGLSRYLQLIISRTDQETSFSARVLDGRAQDPVDQFFQNHLARDCLRDFDHCGQI